MSAPKLKQIIFDVSKKEFGIPNHNMKKIGKKYKGQYMIGLGKEKVIYQKIKLVSMYVFAGPHQPFDSDQLQVLQRYIQQGGSILFLAQQGGDRKNNCNINQFTKNYGIFLNNDLVIRTSFYKYMHPTQALVSNGILSEEVIRICNGQSSQIKPKANYNFLSNIVDAGNDDQEFQKQAARGGLDFLFVQGTSLVVRNPASAVLSSGPLSYPSNRPVGGLWKQRGKGRIAVIGSVDMFSDQYFQLQSNAKLFDFVLKYLLTDQVEISNINKDQTEKQGIIQPVPDVAELADKLKCCFQQNQDASGDIHTMFNTQLYRLDTDLVPDSIQLYKALSLKHQPLGLITPQFEIPFLGLAPAVFPPIPQEPPAPPLQLFDMDDQFALQKVRLAQCTNKCKVDDLQYYVRQSSDILGVSSKVKNRSNPKSVIKYIMDQIINFKRTVPQ